jgi:hypothetical protein
MIDLDTIQHVQNDLHNATRKGFDERIKEIAIWTQEAWEEAEEESAEEEALGWMKEDIKNYLFDKLLGAF